MKLSRPLVERTLLAVGLVCCGIWAYAWADARWFEMREGRRLDRALAAQASHAKAASTPGESFDSFSRPAAPPEEEAFVDLSRVPVEGDLLGRLEIERLGVSALFLEGIEETTLRRGVGHIPGTAPLAEAEKSGNLGVAGHRDSFFRGLKDVGKGDVIQLQTLAGTWRYRVSWTRVVTPQDVDVLDPTGEAALTLVTCYPFHYVGPAPKRFIVRAERIAGSA